MAAKILVKIKPPKGARRDQQKLGAQLFERFKMRDRLSGIRRMIPGINAGSRLRKMQTTAAIQVQKVIVSLTDDQNPRLSGKRESHAVTDTLIGLFTFP